MRITAVLVFALAALGCTKNEGQTTFIKSSDELIRVTGRVKDDPDFKTIYWQGTSILVRFAGTSLHAVLRDEKGLSYFNVVIDGDSVRHIKLDAEKKSYLLASGLSSGIHTIEIVKRNEWDSGKTFFYGMEVNGKLQPLPERNKRVIEFFGNSITSGYAIEDYSGGDSPAGPNTNSYYTYAALTARHFKADLYSTSKTGIGIMVSWAPLIMPELYSRLDPIDPQSRWDFKKVIPDLVVINLFQNDSWLVKVPDHPSFKLRFGNSAPDDAQIIEAYQSFVKKIRDVYPLTPIICTLGSMDAVREGSPWRSYIIKSVEGLGDDKIYVHFLPFIQKEGHPRKEDHARIAESLIQFIDANISW